MALQIFSLFRFYATSAERRQSMCHLLAFFPAKIIVDFTFQEVPDPGVCGLLRHGRSAAHRAAVSFANKYKTNSIIFNYYVSTQELRHHQVC